MLNHNFLKLTKFIHKIYSNSIIPCNTMLQKKRHIRAVGKKPKTTSRSKSHLQEGYLPAGDWRSKVKRIFLTFNF